MSSPARNQDEDCWFHGKISRDEAEKQLLSAGEEDCFLVRESTSCAGDYAISVLHGGVVEHVQIKRHEGDAFFSIDNGPVIHGLDELIKTYQSTVSLGTQDGDSVLLQKPIVKSFPPSESRRHGRTNILHRATKEGKTEIVSELLNCDHRSLDARNEDGQSVVHIAAMNGFNSILSLLIKAGACVNAKDGFNHTPLHYACIRNFSQTTKILLENGNANPQIRRDDNGWVPMHEAAHRGHLDCIRVLYRNYAPVRPRAKDDKLPIHLSLAANHEESVKFFDNLLPRRPASNRDDWYHGPLDRAEAQNTLQLCQAQDIYKDQEDSFSFYLIRKNSRKDSAYVLSIMYQGNFYHFKIGREHNFYFIDDGPYLESLEHIVDHYSRWPDGLPCCLNIPVSPTQTFSQPPPSDKSRSNSLDIPPPLPKRLPTGRSPTTLNRLCNDVANNNRPLPPFCKERIPFELIKFESVLGEGEYGEVHKGELTMGNIAVEVAIKCLKVEDQMNDNSKQEFLQEANLMMALDHDNVVKLIGVCWEPRIYMVQELMLLGSLQSYIPEHASEIVPERDFKLWAHHIAKGMVYMERKRMVHRDLSLRNILLNSEKIAKISDFGLSRAVGSDSDYYTAKQGGIWPVKWYAPECFNYGIFSHASDVWSYGVTLWELYSYGESPYGSLSGQEVIKLLESGERLGKPKHCPDNIFSLMKKCWNSEPELRPKFVFLENFFGDSSTESHEDVPDLLNFNDDSLTDNCQFNDSVAASKSMESLQLIDFE